MQLSAILGAENWSTVMVGHHMVSEDYQLKLGIEGIRQGALRGVEEVLHRGVYFVAPLLATITTPERSKLRRAAQQVPSGEACYLSLKSLAVDG